MSEKNSNCSICAYKQDTSQGMWCPFHDTAVSQKLYCDDFLDDMDSPQWKHLIDAMNEKKISVRQLLLGDILALILMASILFLCGFLIAVTPLP